MNKTRERDEHLEQLWYMKEEGRDSIDALKSDMDDGFDIDIINDLVSKDMVELSEDRSKVGLTKKGQDYACKLIRSHRLAERLLYDVLGGDFESGACEFEHIVTTELVDSICTLLGHPKTCPHGMPIPQGQCCKRSARTAHSSVIPLAELKIGESARIAYVNCKSDQQLHKINGLHLRPGVIATLHQKYPTFVVECEGGNIAVDQQIASSICVWKEPDPLQAAM
ncbi:metal-dependent transcriptional regulator [bacterium]|nr:metal-dependent transcriptional regulator [bacterium]